MPDRPDNKIYTLRHWLFYVTVIIILGTAIGAAHSVFGWSDGLTFAVGIVAGTITCTMALREDLFAPASRAQTRHDRRA
jgi:hypothetical protein